MTRRGRKLTEAEDALWRTAMRDATPAKQEPPAPDDQAQFNVQFESQDDDSDVHDALSLSPRALKRLGLFTETPPPPQGASDAAAPVLTPLTRATPGLDRRTADRLRRGERAPDARIDLHGMTLERAHGALLTFIQSCRAQSMRCVLVITGKGGDYRRRSTSGRARYEMDERRGAIKESVPRWLEEAAFRRHVSGLYPAHLRHGGEGALYVYLRKSP